MAKSIIQVFISEATDTILNDYCVMNETALSDRAKEALRERSREIAERAKMAALREIDAAIKEEVDRDGYEYKEPKKRGGKK